MIGEDADPEFGRERGAERGARDGGIARSWHGCEASKGMMVEDRVEVEFRGMRLNMGCMTLD